MEPGGSLPHSQEPATCPYPKLDQSSSSLPNSVSWRSIFILFSHLRLGVPCGLHPSGIPTKTLYATVLFPISAMYLLYTARDVGVYDYTKTVPYADAWP